MKNNIIHNMDNIICRKKKRMFIYYLILFNFYNIKFIYFLIDF